jgi:hypothetical protein
MQLVDDRGLFIEQRNMGLLLLSARGESEKSQERKKRCSPADRAQRGNCVRGAFHRSVKEKQLGELEGATGLLDLHFCGSTG